MLTKVEKLLKSYSAYGYSSSSEMLDSLRTAAIDAEYWMKGYIGVSYYNSIKTKNNISLTDGEDILCRAEIYCIAANFLYNYNLQAKSIQSYTDASVADVSLGSSTNETGTGQASIEYIKKAKSYLQMVGVNTTPVVAKNVQSTVYSQIQQTDGYDFSTLTWPEEWS
jgi:hypothetical protein